MPDTHLVQSPARERAPAPSGRAPVRIPVALIPGDGIGPEVAAAVRRVLAAAGAPIDWITCSAGESAFKAGVATGVPRETIDAIERTGVVLKGPLATPIGHGGKSANVTLRKLFETYANVRPARELPSVRSPYAGRGVDFVVVRENVEDLYAGIEHMQSPDVAQALKIVTRRGCEKVIRRAFELARAERRGSVHGATKANILKLTEGLFLKVFEEVARDYPDIQAHPILVDNCAHQMAMKPERFEVIVTTNMNGDILSDLASGLVGGLGFAPSANHGDGIAIFEAVHGSAPDIAGHGIANPTALLLSATMMLRHVGQEAVARRVEAGLLAVLEEGHAHTADFGLPAACGTDAYTDAIVKAVEAIPAEEPTGAARAARPARPIECRVAPTVAKPTPMGLVGADVFIHSSLPPRELAAGLELLVAGRPLGLKMISNRGVQVHPTAAAAMPDLCDVHRARFVSRDGAPVAEEEVMVLLANVSRVGRWVHVEKLHEIAGARGYTLAQGEH